MAVSAAKTFVAGEILTASDLNTLNTNILSQGQDIGWPAEKTRSLDGNSLTLDSGGGSSLTAGTNGRLDLALRGVDLFRWDGATGTKKTGLDFIAGATGVAAQIKATDPGGGETDVSINLVPIGTGSVILTGSSAGVDAKVEAAGETDKSIDLVPAGTGYLKLDGNEVSTILAAEFYAG